jgi:hypothetical protein
MCVHVWYACVGLQHALCSFEVHLYPFVIRLVHLWYACILWYVCIRMRYACVCSWWCSCVLLSVPVFICNALLVLCLCTTYYFPFWRMQGTICGLQIKACSLIDKCVRLQVWWLPSDGTSVLNMLHFTARMGSCISGDLCTLCQLGRGALYFSFTIYERQLHCGQIRTTGQIHTTERPGNNCVCPFLICCDPYIILVPGNIAIEVGSVSNSYVYKGRGGWPSAMLFG